MDNRWRGVADRLVQGLGVQPGELVEVRDGTGDLELLVEIQLAVERAGATPDVLLLPADYLQRLWSEVPPEYLARWDEHREASLRQAHRVLRLLGAGADPARAPAGALQAWMGARHRLTEIEEERRLPFLLVVIPTARAAEQLGLSAEQYEATLLPALEASAEVLQAEIERVLAVVRGGQHITIHSGEGCVLHLEHGQRPWLSDDGVIDTADRARGAIVSNLPAGSIYTTVLEERAHGCLWLPRAGEAEGVTLHFRGGRVERIDAQRGAKALAAMFDGHSGEPRRVSHVGIGLNPYLKQPVGDIIVDEHIHGCLFIAFGENRYMGGQNESSLNVDFVHPGVTLEVDGRVIVSQGKLVA